MNRSVGVLPSAPRRSAFKEANDLVTRNILDGHVKRIFSNGAECDWRTLVKEKDRIGLFPPVGKGG